MREGADIGLDKRGPQLVVAVFDDWDTLHAVLVEMETDTVTRTAAVLHARSEVPSNISGLSLLKQMTELRFARSRQRIAATAGQLADKLSARAARGACTLADALHDWLSADQAGQLERQLEKGRLLLCVELHTAEDYSVVCGRLVQASPHMVEICDVKFQS